MGGNQQRHWENIIKAVTYMYDENKDIQEKWGTFRNDLFDQQLELTYPVENNTISKQFTIRLEKLYRQVKRINTWQNYIDISERSQETVKVSTMDLYLHCWPPSLTSWKPIYMTQKHKLMLPYSFSRKPLTQCLTTGSCTKLTPTES